jgi:hypothetical protein
MLQTTHCYNSTTHLGLGLNRPRVWVWVWFWVWVSIGLLFGSGSGSGSGSVSQSASRLGLLAPQNHTLFSILITSSCTLFYRFSEASHRYNVSWIRAEMIENDKLLTTIGTWYNNSALSDAFNLSHEFDVHICVVNLTYRSVNSTYRSVNLTYRLVNSTYLSVNSTSIFDPWIDVSIREFDVSIHEFKRPYSSRGFEVSIGEFDLSIR